MARMGKLMRLGNNANESLLHEQASGAPLEELLAAQ